MKPDLPPVESVPGTYWRHRKTGALYRVIAVGRIEADLTPCVIYQGPSGDVWVRPREEFMDGRFVCEGYVRDEA